MDGWPTARVDYYFYRLEGSGALREEHREEMEDEYENEHSNDAGHSGSGGSMGIAQWATENNDIDYEDLNDEQ